MIGIVNGGMLFFGSRVRAQSFCVLPRPTALGNNGLVKADFDLDELRVPQQPSHQEELNPLIARINESNIYSIIDALSNQFLNRYFNSSAGLAAADWLYQQFKAAARGCDHCSISRFKNSDFEPGFAQDSIVAAIKGRSDSLIIIGAHLDSCAFINPATNLSEYYRAPGDNWPFNFIQRRAPGAVDNGSGTAAILEAFRVLAASGLRPERTVQFIAFAGEEQGLLLGEITGTAGSGVMAIQYRKQGKKIAAMLNLDSVGNPFISAQNGNNPNPLQATDNSIGIFSAASCDPQIWNLSSLLVGLYTNQRPLVRQTAGASDFRSFFGMGYPAGGVVESNIYVDGLMSCNPPAGSSPCNPLAQHTIFDLIDRVNVSYVAQFAKLVLAFAYEASFFVPNAAPKKKHSRTTTIVALATVFTVLGAVVLIICALIIYRRYVSASTSSDYNRM